MSKKDTKEQSQLARTYQEKAGAGDQGGVSETTAPALNSSSSTGTLSLNPALARRLADGDPEAQAELREQLAALRAAASSGDDGAREAAGPDPEVGPARFMGPAGRPGVAGDEGQGAERVAASGGGGGDDGDNRDDGDGPLPDDDGDDGSGRKEPLLVQLGRTDEPLTRDILLWRVIRDRTAAVRFENYATFVDRLFTDGHAADERAEGMLADPRSGAKSCFPHVGRRDAYRALRIATEAFLMQEAGLVPKDEDALDPKVERNWQRLRHHYLKRLGNEMQEMLPYFKTVRSQLMEIPIKGTADQDLASHGSYGILPSSLYSPCMIELIWTYWHEESGLIQALKAISLRFQNRKSARLKDPLAHMTVDPLRPINNLLWGFIEGESDRLTVSRRAHEYQHQYGLSIEGRAITRTQTVERRGKFLEGFHTLLNLCSRFYRDDDDATVYADGFPLLNSLKEVHLLLAQGAHNQYGDLPWVSRSEILIQQWLLARPEMREFLTSRIMVPYQEPWMGRLETMRTLQGWGKGSVHHFRELAIHGEQILLSIRFGHWTQITGRASAVNWAKFWRDEIQTYIHAYRALTGVDLTADQVDYTPPSQLLSRHEKEVGAA